MDKETKINALNDRGIVPNKNIRGVTCATDPRYSSPYERIKLGVDDPVNNPSHYKNHPSGIECIQITEHMNFNLGNTLKYIWRNGLKDATPSLQDLEKARWYLDREINKIKNQK